MPTRLVVWFSSGPCGWAEMMTLFAYWHPLLLLVTGDVVAILALMGKGLVQDYMNIASNMSVYLA